ncbi:hypothetical protein CR513_53272, partial [Mucuna pruriens]
MKVAPKQDDLLKKYDEEEEEELEKSRKRRHINSLIPDIRRVVVRDCDKRVIFTPIEKYDPHKKHHKSHQRNTPGTEDNPSENSQGAQLPMLLLKLVTVRIRG